LFFTVAPKTDHAFLSFSSSFGRVCRTLSGGSMMRASQVFGGVFALAFAGVGLLAFTGNAKVAAPESPVCRSPVLSYPDQAACTREMKAAPTDDLAKSVEARWQEKARAALAPKPDKNRQASAEPGKTRTN
jgi:hypothetical protein